jgi:hypothetical protein
MGFFLSIVVIAVVPFYLLIRWVLRNSRRKALFAKELSSERVEIIKRNVALYRYLPDRLKRDLQGHINIFLAEKHFEGCGGLEITDEIKVTIAANACILLLNRKATYFPKLDSVLVYPSAYVAEQINYVGNMTHIKEKSVRLGEAWSRGIVVLAWDHVRQRAIDLIDGHNVVLHEFAHQLDQENPTGQGVPVLDRRTSYAPWARILSYEYDLLREKVQNHGRDVMDAYGTTNPAEFFAVATETFFEKAKAMKEKHPELYEELRDYYKLDPAEWF